MTAPPLAGENRARSVLLADMPAPDDRTAAIPAALAHLSPNSSGMGQRAICRKTRVKEKQFRIPMEDRPTDRSDSSTEESHPHQPEELTGIHSEAGSVRELKQRLDDAERRLAETETLAAMDLALNQTLELDELVQLIVDWTPRLVSGVGRVVLSLYQEANSLIVPAAVWGPGTEGYPSIVLSKGAGLAGLAVEERRLVNSGDLPGDPRYFPPSQKAQAAHPQTSKFRSLVAAPILNGEQVLGVLNLLSVQPQAFSANDERIITRLASHIAPVLKNVLLYDQERAQRQALQSLSGIDLPGLDINAAFKRMLDYVLWLGLAESANIMLIQNGVLRVASHRGYEYCASCEAQLRAIRIPLDAYYYRKMMETGLPAWVDDVEHDPNWSAFSGARGLRIRSWAGAPLIIAGRTVGFINIDSPELAAFDANVAHRLEFMAAFAVTAIQNLRLHENLLAALQAEQQARSRLEEAEKLAPLGRMVSTVVHEINNPLQSLQNCLYILENPDETEDRAEAGSSSAEERRAFFDVAISEVERLSGLIAQLRDVQRAGRSQPRRSVVDLLPVLERVKSLVARQLDQAGITWKLNPPEEDSTALVMADSDQLVQVFLNLALNAIDAIRGSGQEGEIRIEILNQPGETGVCVADSGPGIDAQTGARLFDPFFTTKPYGLGVGLSICTDIVKAHGGRITLASQRGEGAAFTVWLPRA